LLYAANLLETCKKLRKRITCFEIKKEELPCNYEKGGWMNSATALACSVLMYVHNNNLLNPKRVSG
jgi:hypothetical protein